MKKILIIVLSIIVLVTIIVADFTARNIGILIIATVALFVLVIKKDVEKSIPKTSSQKEHVPFLDSENYGQQAI